MTKIYIVEDESDAYRFAPFAEQTKVFMDHEEALAFAKTRGWDNQLGFNVAVGQKNVCWSGSTKLSILVLEVSESQVWKVKRKDA